MRGDCGEARDKTVKKKKWSCFVYNLFKKAHNSNSETISNREKVNIYSTITEQRKEKLPVNTAYQVYVIL